MQTRLVILVSFVLVALLSLSACSNKTIYDNARQHQQSKCNRLPSGTELEECKARITPDYEVYESNREKLLDP